MKNCLLRFFLFAIIFVGLMTVVCPLSGTGQAVQDEEILKKIRNEVSGSVSFEHVRFLSTLHRIWGSRDFHRAAQYVADKCKDYGLEDAHIEKFPVVTGRESYWLHSGGGNVPWDLKSGEFRLVKPYPELLSHSESAPSMVARMSRAADAEGEVVYVGRGDQAASFAGKDVKGKIVLAEGGRHENAHELAVHGFGALGTIHFADSQGQYRQSEGIYWGNIWPWSADGTKPSTFGVNISPSQGRLLKDLLSRGEKVVVSVRIDAELVTGGGYELATAVIPGTARSEEEFIFYSHLDHPKPGAHDNASGNAVMLEIARSLSSLVQRKLIPPPQRSIRFLWIPHMFGLNLYFFHHQDKVGKVKGGCNIDCVGVNSARFPSQFFVAVPPHSLPTYLTDLTQSLVESFNRMQVMEEDFLFSPEGSRNLLTAVLMPYQGASDEYTANTSSLNMPSIYFYNYPLPPRHSQINFLDYLDRTELGRVAYLGAAVSYGFVSCGGENAFLLLPMLSSRSSERLEKELLKARSLLAVSSPSDIHENFAGGEDLLTWGLRREKGMLDSLSEVMPAEAREQAGTESRRLEARALSHRELLRKEYAGQCRRLGIRPEPYGLEKKEKREQREMSAIPVLNPEIKGSLGYFSNYFEDRLGRDFLSNYKGLRPSLRYGNVGYYETLNRIDGRNSVGDIYRAVRAELWSGDYPASDSLSLDETLSFFRLLHDSGVISFKQH